MVFRYGFVKCGCLFSSGGLGWSLIFDNFGLVTSILRSFPENTESAVTIFLALLGFFIVGCVVWFVLKSAFVFVFVYWPEISEKTKSDIVEDMKEMLGAGEQYDHGRFNNNKNEISHSMIKEKYKYWFPDRLTVEESLYRAEQVIVAMDKYGYLKAHRLLDRIKKEDDE